MAAVGLACGHEPKTDEVNENISPLGPNGEARMFVADQDSSGTRLCFEAPDLGQKTVVIDEAYVDRMLADIVRNEDLSRYIL